MTPNNQPTSKPTGQHYLALGILVLILGILYLLVISPLLERYHSANEQIGSLQFQLQRYHSINQSRSSEELLLESVKFKTPLKGYFLEGETHSVVSAKLQQHLKRLISEVGGQIISTQTLKQTGNSNTEGSDDLPSVTLKVQLKTSIDQLKEILYMLETSKPGLHVANITISSTPVRRSSYARKQVMQPLDVRFNLTGYTTGREVL